MQMTDGPAGTTPPSARLGAGPLTPLLAIVLVMIAALALREIASLVVPVLFGLFLALVAWPLVGRLEARGSRHAVALTATLLVVLAVVVVVALVVAFSIAELVLQVPRYEDRFRALVTAAQAMLAGFGVTVDPEAITSVVSVSQVLSWLRPVASAASATGLGLLVLTLTMIYALVGGSSLRARAEATFGAEGKLLSGIEQFGTDLRKYLLVRAQLGVFAAVLSAILLWVLNVPFPLLWAFLVFAASFIPNIGTFIAVVPPAILALLGGGVVPAVAVVVGYTLINFAQDHFLQPVVMGSELNLTPLVVFLSVLAWAWILGPAGALLAVPLTVGLVAILEAYPSGARIAALLRNRLDERPGLPDLVADPGGMVVATSTSEVARPAGEGEGDRQDR
jgi:predicted PurR-regulated permease PerM